MLKSPQDCYCLLLDLVVSLFVSLFVLVVAFAELLDGVAFVVPPVDALVDDELLLVESVLLADELVVALAAGRCTRNW
jgi:hypothetical protein